MGISCQKGGVLVNVKKHLESFNTVETASQQRKLELLISKIFNSLKTTIRHVLRLVVTKNKHVIAKNEYINQY